MKKKLLILGIFSLVVVSSCGLWLMNGGSSSTEYGIANIEALADDEKTYDVDCSKKGGECEIIAPFGYIVTVIDFQKP